MIVYLLSYLPYKRMVSFPFCGGEAQDLLCLVQEPWFLPWQAVGTGWKAGDTDWKAADTGSTGGGWTLQQGGKMRRKSKKKKLRNH